MDNLKYGDKIDHIVNRYIRGVHVEKLITSYFVKYPNTGQFYYMENPKTPQIVLTNFLSNIANKFDK